MSEVRILSPRPRTRSEPIACNARLIGRPGRRQGEELGADSTRSRLEHDLAALWSVGAMVQQDLAARRDRVAAVTGHDLKRRALRRPLSSQGLPRTPVPIRPVNDRFRGSGQGADPRVFEARTGKRFFLSIRSDDPVCELKRGARVAGGRAREDAADGLGSDRDRRATVCVRANRACTTSRSRLFRSAGWPSEKHLPQLSRPNYAGEFV